MVCLIRGVTPMQAVEIGILRSSCASRDAQLELQKSTLDATQAALATARAAATDAEKRAMAKHGEVCLSWA